ncbi:MAG: phosphotransferase [Propionibacterium sp.]|nr:phosphotransferase [Propionibacterium sp.]
MESFRKQGSEAAIASEAAGLRWLQEAVDDGGAAVAELAEVGDTWLETRLMPHASPTGEEAAEFGRRLARTHAAGAGWWGCAPREGVVGEQMLAGLPLPTVHRPTYASFGEFFAAARLEPYLRMADILDDTERRTLARAVGRVADGAFDSTQPGAVVASGHGAARTHGDLWGGNVVWARTRGGVVGTLIDPAAHGGHAESDLAALHLFGSPHLASTIAGYREVSPLADGWRDRIGMHQLHLLLVHVVLFGRSYVGDTVRIASGLS